VTSTVRKILDVQIAGQVGDCYPRALRIRNVLMARPSTGQERRGILKMRYRR